MLVRHLVVASFLFSGESKYRMHVLCVVWELMRQRFFAVFQLVGCKGLSKVCLCFDGLFCCVACCWVSRAARLLFYRITPLIKQDPLVGVVCGVVCCVRTV